MGFERLAFGDFSHRSLNYRDDEEMVVATIEPPEPYWRRRAMIAELAAGLSSQAVNIEYSQVENAVWAEVVAALDPLWEQHAASDVLESRDRLALPTERVPQLAEVNASLRTLTGFEFRAVPGLVPSVEFFGGLGRGLFSSTQYVRWEGSPLYTPEPDVIHEVFGHGNALACPELAVLHRLAGRALERVVDERSRQALANVFWFTAEFGVVRENDEVRACGAGLLSSVGELASFSDHADIHPINIREMATLGYDIDVYQPVLFAADSVAHVLDEAGGFFEAATDESVAAIIASR
jgi:phenylalanine-4-hydroxylase